MFSRPPGRLRWHFVASGTEEEAQVQIVQMVSGEYLPGTVHTRRRRGVWRGKKYRSWDGERESKGWKEADDEQRKKGEVSYKRRRTVRSSEKNFFRPNKQSPTTSQTALLLLLLFLLLVAAVPFLWSENTLVFRIPSPGFCAGPEKTQSLLSSPDLSHLSPYSSSTDAKFLPNQIDFTRFTVKITTL